MRDPDAFLDRLWALEKTLVAHGFPAMPPWWRGTIERFERYAKRRLVVRKGRRVFASTCVAPRVAVAEMLYGEHPHLRGTPPHTYAFLSVRRDEAARRLRGVREILDVLGEKYTERGDTIELTSRPAVFSVITANYRASVGETVAFVWCDEVARWRDDDSGANPAEEVIGSLSPALATLPAAKMWLVSSPLSTADFHARSFDLGETEQQAVAFGTTWDINPSLTQEATRSIEPNERLWSREYAAIPQGAISAAFSQDDVTKSFGQMPWGYFPGTWTCLIDPSGGGNDPWAWGLVSWIHGPLAPQYLTQKKYVMADMWIEEYLRDEDGKPLRNPDYDTTNHPPRLRLGAYGQIEAARTRGFSLEAIVRDIVEKWCTPNDVYLIVGDQFESFALDSIIPRLGLKYRSLPWSNPSKIDAVRRFSSWLRDGVISIADDCYYTQELKRQLLSFDERITRSGTMTYSGRGTTHDDLVSLCLLAAAADAEGLISHSPYQQRTRRDISNLE